MAVDSHGNPHISYYDEINDDLKHFSGAKAYASPLGVYARTLQPFSNILLITGTAAAVASVSMVIWEEKSEITEKFVIPIGTEKFMKASGLVGLIISLISALLFWVTVYPYSLLNYYSHLDLTVKGLETIFVTQGYKHIALALGFALATYPLALLLGIAALFSRTRKMLSICILSSGTLAVLSGLTWIYGVEAAKGEPVWGGGARPSVGVGAYVVIIAGSILLASYCIFTRLKPKKR